MRPSKNTDQQLVLAARELLLEKGSLEIGLREVATKAGVNMGMFYYHFKNKDDFWLRVLQEFYEEFFSDFKIDASLSDSPLENLRSAAVHIGNFAVKNRDLVIALFCSVVNGDEVTKKFLKKNFIRHIRVIIDLIKQAQKKGQIRAMSPFTILTMLMGAMNAPIFAYIALAKGPLGVAKLRTVGATKENVMSDEAIEERVNLLLLALEKREKK